MKHFTITLTIVQKIDYALRPTNREKEVLDIVDKYRQMGLVDLAKILKISGQQVHNILTGLIEKGYLKMTGKTKGSYYEVK